MNTQQLQEKFPEVYEEFFFKCQKIVSAPHSFFWIGDFSGFYGGLTISSKLPLRFYVGLEQIEPDKFEINQQFNAYFPAEKQFRQIRLDSHIKHELADILKPKLKGYRVHFLSEVALGLSLGGLGAISAALSEILKPSAKFAEKFEVAKMIVTQIQTGRTSAATAYASLCDSPYPSVYYQSGAKSWGKPLDELADLPKKPLWPFDFGLIFSGNFVQGAAVISSAEEIKRISTKRQKEITDLLGEESGNFWGDYMKMLDQVSKQTLLNFVEVLKGASDDKLKRFFEGLNQYQNLLHYLEISTPNIDKIYSFIHRIANKSENGVGSGCKITGVGKGGEVLFAVPYGRYQDKISTEVKSLGESISLDYASWSGGTDNAPVRLEQDLNAAQTSLITRMAKCEIKVYSRAGNRTYFAKDLQVEADLVFDLINSKIFYKNKPVQSSQIPSQKATVEILSNLLKTEKRTLKNSRLGKYGKSRYDLQGKITTPLNKLCGVDFDISGGVYDNFSLKLKPFDISIAVISFVK